MQKENDKQEPSKYPSPNPKAKGDELVVCEIDSKNGQPTCCGPGDLYSTSTPIVRKKDK